MDRFAHRKGFTLLELLIVVAILAIIGGGVLIAYDDLDDRVAEGVAAHTLAGLDAGIRNYTASARSAPNELDSLWAADYPSDPEDATTALSGAERVAILPGNLAPGGTKVLDITLNQAQLDALNAAGITHLRYVDAKGNDLTNPDPDTPGASVTLDVPDADGATATVGPLLRTDIPSRLFESPRPGSNRNRGRGFAKRIGVGDPVMQWNGDRSGGGGFYDNTKIGAGKDDVLLVFGLGSDASCVGAAGGRVQMSAAPVFGKVMPHRYARYLVLYNVGPVGAEFPKARLQVVMNTHGDFIDEMIAEHSGQKP
ncbi:MAG: type II secretion system protein [Planctomycetota bacterium]|jgi:prepilin-type N-terminal cleavage/methylation domain-containing protein